MADPKVRRIQAEFLDVGHVIRREDGEKVAVTSIHDGPASRVDRIIVADLSDGTTRRFRASEIVEVQ